MKMLVDDEVCGDEDWSTHGHVVLMEASGSNIWLRLSRDLEGICDAEAGEVGLVSTDEVS